MRHYSFVAVFTIILLAIAQNSDAKKAGVKKISYTHTIPDAASSETSEMPHPVSPATRHEDHSKKVAIPRSEELPHIHHFHKERVKKSRKHHKKYWLLTQVILILTHIAILVIAYMHVTPH